MCVANTTNEKGTAYTPGQLHVIREGSILFSWQDKETKQWMCVVDNDENEFMLFHPEVDASDAEPITVGVANFDRMEEGQYVMWLSAIHRDLPKREVTLSVDFIYISPLTYVKQPT
ncbi:hypothetical protein SPFM6_00180 [Salmonella phage SPFM6]|nr:hypothetical protein SPFM6_00180 [Salmonella phage SPFM6]